MAPWVIPCRDAAHLAAEAARCVLDAVVRAGDRPLSLALSGGRITAQFFPALVAANARRGGGLARAAFHWADERAVPPDHADSNFRDARELLLQPLAVPDAQVFRLAGELPPEAAVARALADLARLPGRTPAGVPVLDLVILGLGEDGHTASLFPENLARDRARPDWVFATTGAKPPPRRLTLGYPVLAAAKQVLVLAPGAAKAAVLRAALAGDPALPLAEVLLRRTGRETAVLHDHPAA
jgi:6-phosphogluconolactonase